jgi:hypothetical protein
VSSPIWDFCPEIFLSFFFFFKLQSCLIWGALSDERYDPAVLPEVKPYIGFGNGGVNDRTLADNRNRGRGVCLG